MRITTRNAAFQEWQALLTNRAKRRRAGEFLVQGVRPITLAVEHGWPIRALLHADRPDLSRWSRDLLDRVATGQLTTGRGPARQVAVAPELIRELGDKEAQPPELLAVAELPEDRLDRIAVAPRMLVMVFDRPASPGNLGTLVRSAEAFGAAGVIVTGHAADPYDPRAVRASTGSLFAVPVVRAPSHREVLEWVAGLRRDGVPIRVLGTDEHGEVEIARVDLTGPAIVVVGNETRGLSAGWREACDLTAKIPITGAASSLNAAAAATVVLYEATRQRASAGAGEAGDHQPR